MKVTDLSQAQEECPPAGGARPTCPPGCPQRLILSAPPPKQTQNWTPSRLSLVPVLARPPPWAPCSCPGLTPVRTRGGPWPPWLRALQGHLIWCPARAAGLTDVHKGLWVAPVPSLSLFPPTCPIAPPLRPLGLLQPRRPLCLHSSAPGSCLTAFMFQVCSHLFQVPVPWPVTGRQHPHPGLPAHSPASFICRSTPPLNVTDHGTHSLMQFLDSVLMRTKGSFVLFLALNPHVQNGPGT